MAPGFWYLLVHDCTEQWFTFVPPLRKIPATQIIIETSCWSDHKLYLL